MLSIDTFNRRYRVSSIEELARLLTSEQKQGSRKFIQIRFDALARLDEQWHIARVVKCKDEIKFEIKDSLYGAESLFQVEVMESIGRGKKNGKSATESSVTLSPNPETHSTGIDKSRYWLKYARTG